MTASGGAAGKGGGYDIIVYDGVEYRINRNPETNPDGPTEYSGWQVPGIDLKFKNLSRGRFPGANFRGADLSFCDLINAELSGADLRGALLHGTNLTAATLINAKLAGAKMDHRTKIASADFSGTVLGPNPNGINVVVRDDKVVLADAPLPTGYLPGHDDYVEGVHSLGCWGKKTPDLPIKSVYECSRRELPKFTGKWPAAYRLTTLPVRDAREGDDYVVQGVSNLGFAFTLVSGIPAEAG